MKLELEIEILDRDRGVTKKQIINQVKELIVGMGTYGSEFSVKIKNVKNIPRKTGIVELSYGYKDTDVLN